MKFIDDFLNKITMYRLVLYILIFFVLVASALSLFGLLPFSFLEFVFSVSFLIVVGWVTNTFIAKFLQAPTNIESVYISALILALILTPAPTLHDLSFLFWAAVWTVASKFILAIKKKHIFNPVAFGITLVALTLNHPASWWVGNLYMFPFVFIGGLLIVRKIRRFGLVISFVGTAIAASLLLGLFAGSDIVTLLKEELFYSSLFFFATIMLTEPLTTPPTQNLRLLYGSLVGLLFAPQVHLGSFYSSPEIALLIGNLFAYLVSPKEKLFLKLKQKLQVSPDNWDFIFTLNTKFNHVPGQYMEWTLARSHPDSRGERRYFTLASSPTEGELRLGIKFTEPSSTFKKSLMAMDSNQEIVASQLAGDFVLPKDPNEKLVFVAGGIGITPYRSMIKYLLDTKQKRSIVLLYSNKEASEVLYSDVFDQAKNELGLKVVLTITDKENVPAGWLGRVGRIDEKIIAEEIPDYRERSFYLSGPHSLVTAFEDVLKRMGVARKRIKTDYFPGFA